MELIGTSIQRKSKSKQFPDQLKRNNKVYTEKKDIANQFSQRFVAIGANLANLLRTSTDDPCRYIYNSPVSSFNLVPVFVYHVQCLFNALDRNNSSISVPNSRIKMASFILPPVFTVIYNESINTGTVPDVLKISRVITIFKSEIATDPNILSTNINTVSFCKSIRKISMLSITSCSSKK